MAAKKIKQLPKWETIKKGDLYKEPRTGNLHKIESDFPALIGKFSGNSYPYITKNNEPLTVYRPL